MTEDAHARANAEQVRVLREALTKDGEAGEKGAQAVSEEPALDLPAATVGSRSAPTP